MARTEIDSAPKVEQRTNTLRNDNADCNLSDDRFGKAAAAATQAWQNELFISYTPQEKQEGREPRKAPPPVDTRSANEKTAVAMREFSDAGKLTPEIKKVFEDAIAQSDKGQSIHLDRYRERVKTANKALEAVMTPQLQKEIKDLGDQINVKLNKLPLEERTALGKLMEEAKKDPSKLAEAQKKADEVVLKAAPNEVRRLEQIDSVVRPLSDKRDQVSTELFKEENQQCWTRLYYGSALLLAGEKDAAKKMVQEGLEKGSPLHLEDEGIQEFIKEVGLDLEQLKRGKQKK